MRQQWDVEIDQEADVLSCEFQICEQLCLVNRKYLLDALKFDYHDVIYDEVYFVSTIELQSFERDRQLDLSFKRSTSQMQLVA